MGVEGRRGHEVGHCLGKNYVGHKVMRVREAERENAGKRRVN